MMNDGSHPFIFCPVPVNPLHPPCFMSGHLSHFLGWLQWTTWSNPSRSRNAAFSRDFQNTCAFFIWTSLGSNAFWTALISSSQHPDQITKAWCWVRWVFDTFQVIQPAPVRKTMMNVYKTPKPPWKNDLYINAKPACAILKAVRG